MLPRLSLLGLAALFLLPMAALGFVPSVAPTALQQHQSRARPVVTTRVASAPAAAGTDVVVETFILPMGDDTQLKIRLRPDTFKDLVARTNQLLASFRTIKAANANLEEKAPPPREPSLIFETRDFDTRFFLECNPNIYPDAFHATVFVKVNNGIWEVTSQCQLSALVDALKMYKGTYNIELPQPQQKQ